jgi:O-antigen ligase
MKEDFSLMSQSAAGITLIAGFLVILAVHIVAALPLLTTLGMTGILILGVTFAYRPLWGFLATVVIRTSVDFLDNYISIALSQNISLNIAAILAIVLIGMATVISIANYRTFLHLPLLILFFLFIFFSGASVLYSIDTAATIQETLRIISIFAAFAGGYVLCKTSPDARRLIISTILVSSIIPLSLALFQIMTGTGFSDNLGTDGRLFGTFKHPNSFASFLMIIIALMTYHVFGTFRDRQSNTATITLLVFTIGILLLTFSRGGWFALLIFFGIFSIMRAPKIILIGAVTVVVLFFTSQTVHDRIEDIYNPPADSSIRWRIQQWRNAVEAWRLSPVLGYGAGTEIAIFEQEQGYYAGNPYTHNDFIKALQETGVVGVSLFALVLITTLVYLLLTYRSLPRGNEKLFVLIVTLLFIAEIGFGMSSNIWRGTAVQWMLWILIAYALSLNARGTYHSGSFTIGSR